MADGWPQVMPILECCAQLRYMCPAFSRHEHEHRTGDARQRFGSHSTATRLSGSDNVFDLHTAVRLISDLNNICFVIDVHMNEHVVTGMAQDIEFRPYDLLVNPACFKYHHRHASAELRVHLIYCSKQVARISRVAMLSTWFCDGNSIFLWKEDMWCIIISWQVRSCRSCM